MMKAQWVRIADVVFIGPLMIWGGRKAKGLGGKTLMALGVSTIIYNGQNYIAIRDQKI